MSEKNNPSTFLDNLDIKKDKIILNLKILSNIEKLDKISTNSDNISIDPPHLLQSLYRTYNGDSRTSTINKIDNIIKEVFDFTNDLLETQSLPWWNNNSTNEIKFKNDIISVFQELIIHLNNSIGGLQNLKLTYINDVSICSNIDLIISKIQNRINKINSIMTLTSSNN
tara:strand:- start:169 stop:675 length:507 start_codon:yes stop_codon:yes gene_type:complete